MVNITKKIQEKFAVRMLENLQGTEDGFTIRTFKKGETYLIAESLFNSFRASGACELIEEVVEDVVQEVKIPVVKKRRIRKKSPVKENKVLELEAENKEGE